MRSFFKLVFTSCLGTILAILLTVIVLMIIGAVSGSGKNDIQKNSVLLLDFEGLFPEKTNNVEENNQFTLERPNALGVFEAIDLIKHAATDDRISHVVLKGDAVRAGAVNLNQFADALKYFKENSDTPIWSYGDFYTQAGYLLASETDSIFLNPEGGIDFKGFGVMVAFGKELLEKLGVKINVFYAGEFKSAAEVFYRNEMSENNKLQTREFLQELHNNFIDRIANNRGIEKSYLNRAMNNYSFSSADSTLAYKATDEVMQWHEFENKIRERHDIKRGKKINYMSIGEYDRKTVISKKSSSKNRIAVVFAEGEIQFGNENNGVINEKVYHEIFDKIRRDNKVKAVVLRVNSPGGSSFTSEAILQEVKEIQASGIPVIASFGNYAASGGYYISCSADTIVAAPNTLTGSIGAFSIFPDASRLFEDKLGVHFDTVKTGTFATSFNPVMSMSEQDKQFVDRTNKRIYNTFLGRVAEGRGMSFEEVEKVAKGRVWTGNKAKELNLVDVIGGLDTAIEIAAERAGLEDYKLREFPNIKTPAWVKYLELMNQEVSISIPGTTSKLSREFTKLKSKLDYYTEHKSPMVLMPYEVQF